MDVSPGTELDNAVAAASKLDIGLELITCRPTKKEAFGECCELLPQGRCTQIDEILRQIRRSNVNFITNRRGALFFHASPGMGKTFLLSQLYDLNTPDIHFFVADFSRNACDDAAPHSEIFLRDPELFILLRLHYVELVDQVKHTWIGYINKVLDKFRTAVMTENYKKCIREMLRERFRRSKCKISVLLVDEISKTRAICAGEAGIEFSHYCRSYLCNMADADNDICNLVIFSTSDVPFMMRNINISQRPMMSVCTLPLLTLEETCNILSAEVKCDFKNEEDMIVSRDQYLEQLADVCGGHARSIEYIVAVCNNNIVDEADKKNVSDIIATASSKLIGAICHVDHHDLLLKAILLGEEVQVNDMVGSESYESLVNRGILLNSLDDVGSFSFVPMCPELFLHAWIRADSSSRLSPNLRRLLRQILELRGKFARQKFENLHCLWEQLIRLVRPAERYRKISLRDVYRVNPCAEYNNRESAVENATSYLVDASAEVILLQYNKEEALHVRLNSIVSPKDKQNPGWDHVIFYEAFPSGKSKRSPYCLPVFIHNKFSPEDSTTKLTLASVNAAVKHCKYFLRDRCRFTECQLIPKKTKKWFRFGNTKYQFVLVYILKQDSHHIAISDAPPNVIFCCEDDLKLLYGKALSGFAKYVVPDSTIYATAIPAE